MCGIVGIICKKQYGFTHKNLDVLETLLYLDALRGEDSTGVFSVNMRGDVDIAKEASVSGDFLKSKEWLKIRGDAIQNGFAVIGHNRKATRGSITDENAHPFWVDDKLVLVHNGTMWGDHKKHADVEVDSHAVAHVLAKEDNVEKALQQINAAYALSWYDFQNKRLHFIRNQHRPLWWVDTDDAFYICSEPAMLIFALGRNGVTPITKRGHTPNEFPEYSLNTWALDQKAKKWELTHARLKNAAYIAPAYVKPESTTDACNDACDDSGYLGDDNYYQYVMGVPRKWQTIQEEIQEAANKTPLPELPSGSKPYPWWQKATFKKWGEVKSGKYSRGNKVTVVVDNFDDASVGNDIVFLSGMVAGDPEVLARFPVSSMMLSVITDPERKEKAAVFTIEVDQLVWKNYQDVGNRNIDNIEGYMTLRGTKPALQPVETVTVQ